MATVYQYRVVYQAPGERRSVRSHHRTEAAALRQAARSDAALRRHCAGALSWYEAQERVSAPGERPLWRPIRAAE